MDDKIIATFCLCDNLLKAMHHQEDRQCQMNDAEIMTTAFVASLFFRGNHESARAMLQQYGYIPHMLSKSRFSRRPFAVRRRCSGPGAGRLPTDATHGEDALHWDIGHGT